MEVSGDHKFEAPRTAVWAALLDPAALKASMPGCEKFEEVGTNSYDLTIRIGIAAIKGTYTGNVQVVEPVENESYRLVVSGTGKPGRVQGDAKLMLSDEGEGTRVTYTGEVKAQGAISRLGSRLLGGAARLMIGQFMKAMEEQVARREEAQDAKEKGA
ncbi:MAG: carbon monoxide dehydrogenase subunit G [Dehalococcoidia bacterium]|nr:carbon monoxide dehydrogenase subunit G [Dehalococcoidia bacterium]